MEFDFTDEEFELVFKTVAEKLIVQTMMGANGGELEKLLTRMGEYLIDNGRLDIFHTVFRNATEEERAERMKDEEDT